MKNYKHLMLEIVDELISIKYETEDCLVFNLIGGEFIYEKDTGVLHFIDECSCTEEELLGAIDREECDILLDSDFTTVVRYRGKTLQYDKTLGTVLDVSPKFYVGGIPRYVDCNELIGKRELEPQVPITQEPMDDKVAQFKAVLDKMLEVYIAKNNDYGNSVQDTYNRLGDASFLTRIMDKVNRLETLCVKGVERKVQDEKIEDTLLDLANYAILFMLTRNNK